MILENKSELTFDKNDRTEINSFMKMVDRLPASVSKMNYRTKKYDFINRQYEIITGLDLESLNNSTPEKIMSFIFKEDIKKISDSVNKWLTSNAGKIHNIEYRGFDSLRNLKWFDSYIFAEFDKAGDLIFIIQVDLDITERKLKEIEISRSESMLISLMNNVKHCLWSVDKNFRLVKYNKVFEQEMKNLFDVQVYPGMLVVESIREERELFKEMWYEMYKKALKGESFTVEKEYEIFGDTRYIIVSMNPINESGHITGLTAFSYDVTNMKKSREMLLESESRYQIIIDNLNEGILITDKNDKLLFCNKACENIFGINKDEMIGLDLKNFHDDKNKKIIEDQNKLRALGKSTSYEMDIIRKDKTTKTIFVSASPRYDKGGAFNGSYVVALDIDDKKRTENEIVENEEKLRAITENINCMLWIYDEKTNKVIYANSFYKSLFGADVQELYQDPESWIKYLYPGDVDYYNENKNNRPVEGLTYRIVRNSEIRWVNSKIFPLYLGNYKRIVGIAEDITAFKEKEKQLENAKLNAELANRAKSDFLAVMSHEIRTPLNGISGFTQMMTETSLTENQKEYLDLIKESSSKLLRVINDILDFSKIAAGRLEFDSLNFSVKEAVIKSIQTVELAAKDKGLKIRTVISDSIPELVTGDSERLQQVLLNLLSNSIKFSANSEVVISVNTIKQQEDKIKLEFRVKDHGIGISEAEQKLLFQPFVQADSSYSRKFGGTGLGLAICKNLVEMMKGEIGLESKSLIGSVFYFTAEFLLQKPQIVSLEPMTIKKNQSASPQESVKYNILVVEDEIINQKLVRKILEKYGHTVLVCSNGAEAIENLGKDIYDVVLMDIQMPVMNGIDATLHIRKSEKKSMKHIPIIAMTANAFVSDKEKCFAVGMDEFISKPININDMLQKIHSKVSEAASRK
ncbi:hypothetical protein BH10BAC5_BH10BAC5_14580 [soil metagenome]